MRTFSYLYISYRTAISNFISLTASVRQCDNDRSHDVRSLVIMYGSVSNLHLSLLLHSCVIQREFHRLNRDVNLITLVT